MNHEEKKAAIEAIFARLGNDLAGVLVDGESPDAQVGARGRRVHIRPLGPVTELDRQASRLVARRHAIIRPKGNSK